MQLSICLAKYILDVEALVSGLKLPMRKVIWSSIESSSQVSLGFQS